MQGHGFPPALRCGTFAPYVSAARKFQRKRSQQRKFLCCQRPLQITPLLNHKQKPISNKTFFTQSFCKHPSQNLTYQLSVCFSLNFWHKCFHNFSLVLNRWLSNSQLIQHLFHCCFNFLFSHHLRGEFL